MAQLIIPEQVKKELSRILAASADMEQHTEKLQATLRTHGHLVKSPVMDTAIESLADIRRRLEAMRMLFEDRAALTLEGAKRLIEIEGNTDAIKEAAR